MLRFSASLILGIVLFLFEAYIVMFLKGNSVVHLGSLQQFITAWAVNFFFVFAILTHIKMWYEEREESETQTF